MRILILPAVLSLMLTWNPSQAQSNYFQEYNKTIGHLGVQATTFYVQFAEGTGQPCNEVYIAPERKPMYIALLTAKITGRKLSRVDYYVTNGMCWAEIIEIAP